MQQTNETDPNKTQSTPAQSNPPPNHNIHTNRPNGPPAQNKSAMEIEVIIVKVL
jgi:hypothetical protein